MPDIPVQSPGRRVAALLAGLLLALPLSVGLAPSAQAHNTLISSSPEDGATLDAPPEEVVLTFNADVLEGGNGIVVTGPDGADYADGEVVVDGSEASVALAPLTVPGEYTIDYRIVSADGHPLSDTLSFTLDESAVPEPSPSPSEAEEPGEEETPPPASVEEEAATDVRSLAGPFAPVLGVLAAIGGIAVIAIIVIRLRRRPGSGD
ncbi:copper resistance CopC family protein [Thermobifida cellulosilytica]|uniref:Copper resistance protein CopC n=1 Tax=Thermobifida cellulosilytica TB100 TaxID=665004 RepID=A0A147KGF6_THECS|nr:copper resistance CopC family protein [Thermobifida cellulosilytica]KUP96377.1 copper resistance protein CopC [Thermobifida cellulosilytica TB100]